MTMHEEFPNLKKPKIPYSELSPACKAIIDSVVERLICDTLEAGGEPCPFGFAESKEAVLGIMEQGLLKLTVSDTNSEEYWWEIFDFERGDYVPLPTGGNKNGNLKNTES